MSRTRNSHNRKEVSSFLEEAGHGNWTLLATDGTACGVDPTRLTPVSLLDLDHWLKDGRPDWPAIDFAVPCARCGYDLRMLTVARCPECGLAFEWTEVFRARVLRHPFLFEHNWRRRPIRSYLRTVLWSLYPWGFWRAVSLHEMILPGPLLFLWLSAPVVAVLLLHAMAAAIGLAAFVGVYLAQWGYWSVTRATFAQLELYHYVGVGLALPPREWREHWLALAFLLANLVGSTILLLLLRQTLGRCKVRSIQVFRVAAYTATPAVAVAMLCFVPVALRNQYSWMIWRARRSDVLVLVSLLLLLPVVICGPYLSLGLSRYLHLPRPWSLGMTAALVGSLFGLVVLQYLGLLR